MHAWSSLRLSGHLSGHLSKVVSGRHCSQIRLSLRDNGQEESRLLNLRRLRSSRLFRASKFEVFLRPIWNLLAKPCCLEACCAHPEIEENACDCNHELQAIGNHDASFQGAAKAGRQQEFNRFFFVFGTLSVTFWSLFLMLFVVLTSGRLSATYHRRQLDYLEDRNLLKLRSLSGRAWGDGTKVTERAQNTDFRRKQQIFADSPLPLEIPAFGFGGCRNRLISQEAEDFRRKLQETADWALSP